MCRAFPSCVAVGLGHLKFIKAHTLFPVKSLHDGLEWLPMRRCLVESWLIFTRMPVFRLTSVQNLWALDWDYCVKQKHLSTSKLMAKGNPGGSPLKAFRPSSRSVIGASSGQLHNISFI